MSLQPKTLNGLNTRKKEKKMNTFSSGTPKQTIQTRTVPVKLERKINQTIW